MNYIIYSHTNKINNKKYIGQTKQNVNQRWRNGNGYKYCPSFYRAIQKYGWDNFEHEILYENLTKDEADSKEIELISYYNTTNPDYGYNISSGGTSDTSYCHTEEARMKISKIQTGRHLTDEWKQHISDSVKGEKHPFYGKKFSDEHRKHLSESHMGQTSALGFLGKKHTEESKKKMSLSRMGHETSLETRNKISIANSKKVKCIETGIVYSGLPEASLDTGCPKSSISLCCNGKQKSSKGYHWEYVD